jgi:Protein of unknown function (DUF4011)
VRVSSLFPDLDQRGQMLRRVRTIHNKAKENFEERGLETLSIGCGLASWENKRGTWEPCAPVLLQPTRLRPLGAAQDDFELAVVRVGSNVRPTSPGLSGRRPHCLGLAQEPAERPLQARAAGPVAIDRGRRRRRQGTQRRVCTVRLDQLPGDWPPPGTSR